MLAETWTTDAARWAAFGRLAEQHLIRALTAVAEGDAADTTPATASIDIQLQGNNLGDLRRALASGQTASEVIVKALQAAAMSEPYVL